MSARMVVSITKATKARPMGALHIQCHVKPGVNKNREGLRSISDDAVELNVAAPPRDGESNKAVIRVMSEALNVPKSEVSISAGLKSREKTIEVHPSALGLTQNGGNRDDWPALVKQKLTSYIASST